MKQIFEVRKARNGYILFIGADKNYCPVEKTLVFESWSKLIEYLGPCQAIIVPEEYRALTCEPGPEPLSKEEK
jgi:hypothetical protein